MTPPRRLLTRAATGICLAGAGLAIAYALMPGRGALELQVSALVAGATVVLAAVLAVRDAFPQKESSALAAALNRRRQPESQRPPGLVGIERLVLLAVGTALDFHYRLRPILREIAAQRLADNRGLRLDGGGPRVELVLGTVQRAAFEHQVAFFETDIATSGGNATMNSRRPSVPR